MTTALRLLHLEDNPVDAELILATLNEGGIPCEADRVDRRETFVAALKDGRIDLIVSDVGLPGLNGRKLAEIAREKRHTVPILFVTGYADGVQDRDAFLGDGMDMLAKPFQNDELAARVNAMLT